MVTTVDARTGEPLPGATVSVGGATRSATTNGEGRVRISEIPPGTRTVEVFAPDYAPEFALVRLDAARPTRLSFALEEQTVISLPGIHVEAPRRPSVLETRGFNRRRDGGFGAFLTREEIERSRPFNLSSALRGVPGIVVIPGPFSDARVAMRRSMGTGRCPIQYFVDGMLVSGFNIDDVRPGDVEGIEIYRGASEIPPEFNRGSALCGVIVIWTRIDE